MATLFSRIISGEIPCHRVAEDDRFLAFLDIQPVARGHVLVIPKHEVDYIFDMEDEDLADLHLFSRQVAIKLRRAVPCLRIGVAVIGLEVPHAHIHLVPMSTLSDLNFQKERLKFTSAELATLAKAIREA
ncbi:MAG: HIT family protein [Flavobacteriales bacterium]